MKTKKQKEEWRVCLQTPKGIVFWGPMKFSQTEKVIDWHCSKELPENVWIEKYVFEKDES